MVSIFKFKHFVLILMITFLCFFTANSSSKGVALENRAYLANGISIVEDYDFNIINNILDNARWIVSETYNYPDMHFDGIVSMYLPFFVTGKIIKPFAPDLIQTSKTPENIYFICAAVFSVFILLASFKILFTVFEKANFKENILLTLFLFSTPLFFYTFVDFTSSDIACFFYASILLFRFHTHINKTDKDILLNGMLFGFGYLLKPSFLFYVPLFIFSLPLFSSKLERLIRSIVLFSLPCLLLISLKASNNYLRYNFLSLLSGYNYDFYIDKPDFLAHLKKTIFGPCGIIHQAPWLIFSYIIGVVQLFKNNWSTKSKIILSALMAITLKFSYEALCLSDSEFQYGFRRYLIDLPFCCYFIYDFLIGKNKKVLKITFFLIVSLFVYNLFYFYWYNQIDLLAGSPFGVYKMWEFYPKVPTFSSFITLLNRFNFLNFKIEFFLILIIVILLYPILYWCFNKKHFLKIAVILSSFYLPMAFLNFYNNRINVSKMKNEKFFEKMVVSNNLNVFLYDEIISELGRNILIAKYKNNNYEFNKSKDAILNYISTLNNFILIDPIGFKDTNNHRLIRTNAYDTDINSNTILDFNSKSYYNKAFDH